jgi:anthranilate phosphoribosyltransferase
VYAAGRADSLQDGVAAAATAVDSGAAGDILERFVSRTQELAAS